MTVQWLTARSGEYDSISICPIAEFRYRYWIVFTFVSLPFLPVM